MNKIGNLLKTTRESKGLSIDDVVKQTKIQKIYLDAIEQGDLSFFKNQEFYQQVFVGRYAEFLGLNKGEVLADLHNDLNDVEQPKASKEAETIKSAEPVVETEVAETKEIVSEGAIDENQLKAQEILDNIKKPSLDQTGSQEITQLIEEINKHDNTQKQRIVPEVDVEPTISINKEIKPEQAEQEQPVQAEADHIAQNNSILDQIAQINKEASEKASDNIDMEIAPNIKQIYQKDSSPLESTAVIDLTSGIELETVKNKPNEELDNDVAFQQMMEESLAPKKEEQEQPIDNHIPFETEQPVPDLNKELLEKSASYKEQDKMGIDELEQKLHTATNLEILNADPNKTAMDLKIAKALGDSKAVMDDDTNKKIRKDRIINTLLIILIIILVIYFVYQIFL